MLLGISRETDLVWSSACKYHLVFHSNKSLFHPIQFCWSHGGYLAEINSQEEDEMLDEVLLHEVEYWIGLNDLASEGMFQYI